jgi:tRNA (adenine57-N1/adenine58-N1)-methyltransferase
MIQEGELINLYHNEQRKYLLKVKHAQFHTDKGFIDLTAIIGKNFGEKIVSNLGYNFYILKPTLEQLVMKVKRHTQIIYPKDIGIILTKATIFPGAKIIEAGSGSGAFTSAAAYYIRPNGKIYSYEQRRDLFENAKQNIEKNNLTPWVEISNKKIENNFEQKNADFILIDIGSPWELIRAAYQSLKAGHKLATICPSFEQLSKTVFTLGQEGFTDIETLEVLTRRILVRPNRTRPEQRMPSHTGFLVFATKISQ